MTVVRRLARPLLAAVFITGGLDALRHPSRRAEQAAPVVTALSGFTGIPDDPELAVRANGALMTTAGLMLATGRLPRMAGGLLAAALVPTTYAAHPFWSEQEPEARRAALVQFQKNTALLGGVLLAAVDTEGKPGLPWRARHAASATRRAARRAAATTRREARLAARSTRTERRQARTAALAARRQAKQAACAVREGSHQITGAAGRQARQTLTQARSALS
ncbi:MAG TPA: DoxX family protein [Dermatophilaceae bacterium]|nr:DoxX family protein [Dermatophilaceae bacterium]